MLGNTEMRLIFLIWLDLYIKKAIGSRCLHKGRLDLLRLRPCCWLVVCKLQMPMTVGGCDVQQGWFDTVMTIWNVRSYSIYTVHFFWCLPLACPRTNTLLHHKEGEIARVDHWFTIYCINNLWAMDQCLWIVLFGQQQDHSLSVELHALRSRIRASILKKVSPAPIASYTVVYNECTVQRE